MNSTYIKGQVPDKPAWKKFRRKVGANLEACRKAQGLSLEEFAELFGYHLIHILNLERGKGKVDLPMVFHLTRVLKIPTDMIFRV